jgi:hypothetical protein
MRSICRCAEESGRRHPFEGNAHWRPAADEIMAMGIAMVPEGRKLFPSLSVEENLQIGAYGRQTDGILVAWRRSTSCSPCSGNAAAIPARLFGRAAADGRHRPGADEQSAGAAVRRDFSSGSRR